MPMKEDFRALILSDPGITALVGDRLAWGQRNQAEALPALVANRISLNQNYTHQGRTSLSQARVQLDVYAASEDEAGAIEAAIDTFLQPVAFVAGATSFTITTDSRRENWEGESKDAERLFRISTDFNVLYTE